MKTENPTHPDNIQLLWTQLLTFARRKGVPYNDAVDLVQSTFLATLQKFEQQRGEMGALCGTALKNLIINYWRDKKHPELIDEELLRADDPLPDEIMMIAEREKRMKDQLNRIKKELTPAELAFMEAYGEALEELEDRAVSEAARRVGLTPAQGHDLLRKIKRKVHRIEELPLRRSVPPAAPSPTPERLTSKQDSNNLILRLRVDLPSWEPLGMPPLGRLELPAERFEIARAYAHEASCTRFWATLGSRERAILTKI